MSQAPTRGTDDDAGTNEGVATLPFEVMATGATQAAKGGAVSTRTLVEQGPDNAGGLGWAVVEARLGDGAGAL